MKPRLACLLALLLVELHATNLPDPVIPQGVGVNIHFVKGHTEDLELIAKAGFKIIRMDFSWAGTERRRGEYDWSGYDELTRNLEQRGLRPIYILDYSNPLYEEEVVSRDPVSGQEHRATASPQHPESVAAFARWAGAAARHFRGKQVIWEIWNEPNISFWKPKPDVRQYTTLALATCQAIREVDPKATIIGPATSEVPLRFLEDFFASGVLSQLDAVSVHPYRNYAKPPETVAEEYAKVRALIDRYAPKSHKAAIPIISGEWGYASHTKGVTPEVQGAFLARQQLVNLLQGVPISIWYDWKNDGNDPNEREHNFGTVTPDLQPKPAYQAVSLLTEQLGGYRLARRVEVGSAEDYLIRCENRRGDVKWAAWTTTKPHAISVRVKAKGEGRLQLHGAGTARFDLGVGISARRGDDLQIQAGQEGESFLRLHPTMLEIGLTTSPVYLTLSGIRVRE